MLNKDVFKLSNGASIFTWAKNIHMKYLQNGDVFTTNFASDSNILVSYKVLFLCNYHDMIGTISQNLCLS